MGEHRLSMTTAAALALVLVAALGVGCTESGSSFKYDSITIDPTHDDGYTLFLSREKIARYDEITALLPQNNPRPYFIVDQDLYDRIFPLTGYEFDPKRHEELTAELERWRARKPHEENIQAFYEFHERIFADRVVSPNEIIEMCVVAPQWESYMQDALEYIAEYRRLEPETVAESRALINVETRARAALEALAPIEC